MRRHAKGSCIYQQVAGGKSYRIFLTCPVNYCNFGGTGKMFLIQTAKFFGQRFSLCRSTDSNRDILYICGQQRPKNSSRCTARPHQDRILSLKAAFSQPRLQRLNEADDISICSDKMAVVVDDGVNSTQSCRCRLNFVQQRNYR